MRTPFVLAPALVTAYGLIRLLDGLDGARGPGVLWTLGHLAFLVALALFVPVFLAMRSALGRTTAATVTVVAGFAGIAAAAAQFVIDIAVGLMAAGKAEMSALFDQVQSVPGVVPVVYAFGPVLFYLALLALAVQLAVARRVPVWSPVAVAVSVVLPIVSLDLLPLAGILMLVAFVPFIRERRFVAA
ncbi:MAG: hypothetical protein HOV86_19515 [Thermoactinospora sp.]|nr:hypothetical protein [Thermoactinospora sp.]